MKKIVLTGGGTAGNADHRIVAVSILPTVTGGGDIGILVAVTAGLTGVGGGAGSGAGSEASNQHQSGQHEGQNLTHLHK